MDKSKPDQQEPIAIDFDGRDLTNLMLSTTHTVLPDPAGILGFRFPRILQSPFIHDSTSVSTAMQVWAVTFNEDGVADLDNVRSCRTWGPHRLLTT